MQSFRGKNILWHPICHDRLHAQEFPDEDWIQVFLMDHLPPDWNPCYYKFNHFAETYPIEDGDYFTFITDDNDVGLDFFPTLQRYKGQVIICSELTRKGFVPASKDIMRVLCFDLSQLTVRGDVLRKHRFENLWYADGVMAEILKATYPINYAVDAILYHNILRPEEYGQAINKEPLLPSGLPLKPARTG